MIQQLRISCDTCVMQDTDKCADCVVSYLCGAPQAQATVFDFNEAKALRMLASAGLVPACAHVSKSA